MPRCSGWRQTFSVKSGEEEEIFKIVGPCRTGRCVCCACKDHTFNINSAANGEQIGALTKQFSETAKVVHTNTDNFSVSFPKDLHVRAKALVLSSVFLIDFLFYEFNAAKECCIWCNCVIECIGVLGDFN
ncbi:phospholipid scramblase 2-like [Symsagittifera roscoffensis]|uniref:phospholipid scramblase 2-like n=1 Tax=Symsagittifera roscoffensis TaxID=84072 RepID=UPI00307C52BF